MTDLSHLTELALSFARSMEQPRMSDAEWERLAAIFRRMVGYRDEKMFEEYYVVKRMED